MKWVVLFAVFNFQALAKVASTLQPSLARVEGGSISPFWLESMSTKGTVKKNAPAKLKVSDFEVMPKQVTVLEFKKFLNDHSSWSKENISSLFADKSYLENLKNEKIDDNAPMTSISWFAAKAYCESHEMRLPSTNEWEYIAAASESLKDASGDPKFLSRILEWYGNPQGGSLKSVGSIYKNVYGIWDLHGSVWEWVSDFNSNFITGESREDSSLNKDMFCGGGGLAGGNKENYAAFMRYAFRSSLKGTSSVWNLGFRCVR
jgi:formylglycine-generating enzyme